MSRVPPEEHPIPTPVQLDLLKAAFLPAPEASDAWTRWRARGMQLDVLDRPSGRMLACLWANREAAGVEAADHALLKGVYRQTIADNAMTISAGFRNVDVLERAGIPVVVTKGAALLAVTGGRLGVRRTSDVDVLVPEAEAERAIAVLLAAGYTPTYQGIPNLLDRRHAWACADPAGREFDLHWWAYKNAGDDRPVFETSREATLIGRTVRVPSPTELLLQTLAHGFGAAPAAPMRWIADALLLLDLEGTAVEWDVLVDRARERRVVLSALEGLRFLRREFSAPVPSETLGRLADLSVDWPQRAAFRAAMRPRVGATLWSELTRHRSRRLHDPHHTPRDVLGHLAQVYHPFTTRRAFLRRQLVKRTVGLEEDPALDPS